MTSAGPLEIAITVIRPFHAAQTANALRLRRANVSIFSSAPRNYFKGLDPAVPVRLVPAPIPILARVVPFRLPESAPRFGLFAWDRMVATVLPRAQIVIGFASQSLATGHKARRSGARFLLDRACPHVDFQQDLVREESEAVGCRFQPEPAWYRDRQLEEYGLADNIIVPSQYSARTFPQELQHKIVIAPLLGRIALSGIRPLADPPSKTPFTVGVLGGNPLRKGYLYLLEAWKQLELPNARLLLRVGDDFSRFPRLTTLLRDLPNVELVRYVPDIGTFYRQCDVFCLPSVDDGFGMALCEAMAEGVACIATENCGASELMTDGVDGLIVPARDSSALAHALQSLHGNADFRQSLARTGKHTILRAAQKGLYERALWTAIDQLPATPPVDSVTC